jgi:hypothetical protein
MYRWEHGLWRFSQKLDSEDGGEHLSEARSGAPLARGEGHWLTMELPDQVLGPCVRFSLCRDTNEN